MLRFIPVLYNYAITLSCKKKGQLQWAKCGAGAAKQPLFLRHGDDGGAH